MRPLVALLALAAVALWVLNCSGPRPTVSGTRVQAPQRAGDPYQMTASVRDDGPGHGQVDVLFRLRDTRTGMIYQATEKVTLSAGETVVVTASINAPQSHYDASVEADYPPG